MKPISQKKYRGKERVDAQIETIPITTFLAKQHQPEKIPQETVLDKASRMINQVTIDLYAKLISGQLRLSSIDPEKSHEETTQSLSLKHTPQTHSRITLDPQQLSAHRLKVHNFMLKSTNLRKNMQRLSLQLLTKLKTQQAQQTLKIKQERACSLQIRRMQIKERLKEKQERVNEVKRIDLESKMKVKKILMEMRKEKEAQQHRGIMNSFVTRQREEAERILNAQKERMKPMDLDQILEHDRQYSKIVNANRANRTMEHSKVVALWQSYAPPQFVPKAYLLAQKDDQFVKEKERSRIKTHHINTTKKKKFLECLEQIKKVQKQLANTNTRTQSKDQFSKKMAHSDEQDHKEASDLRNQRQLGNNYLRQVIQEVKRLKKSGQTVSIYNQDTLSKKHKLKTQQELELIREVRTKKMEKIRYRKISQIVNSDQSQYEKIQKLRYEANRLDKFARQKFDTVSQRKSINLDDSRKKSRPKNSEVKIQDLLDINEGASIVMNSIQAKLAILNMTETQRGRQTRFKTSN